MTTHEVGTFNRLISTLEETIDYSVRDCEVVINATARTKADHNRRAGAFRIRDALATLNVLLSEVVK
jgi:hypothetical protein